MKEDFIKLMAESDPIPKNYSVVGYVFSNPCLENPDFKMKRLKNNSQVILVKDGFTVKLKTKFLSTEWKDTQPENGKLGNIMNTLRSRFRVLLERMFFWAKK